MNRLSTFSQGSARGNDPASTSHPTRRLLPVRAPGVAHEPGLKRTWAGGLIGLCVLLFVLLNPAQASLIFTATLDGDQEVPPVDTTAFGHAHFEFNEALTEMYYELHVFDIVDITQAHIHLAPPGVNGPVVLWLYPSGPPAALIPGEFNGLLASGTVSGADLVGELAGELLSALHAEMLAGNSYVNVHTLGHPPGEIRGQITAVPEPSILAVLGLGLGFLWIVCRKRKGHVPAARCRTGSG
jgi:hypothetical protein